MTARRLVICLVLVVVAGNLMAETTLQELGAVETPAPWSWRPWGNKSFVVTDIDVRMVRWHMPVGERDELLFGLPAPPSLLEAWGDSVLIQVTGEGGRLLDRTSDDPADWIDVAADWRLPNTEIDGQQYRIFVDPQFYLIVFSAPGPGVIVSLLDFPAVIGEATHWSWDGDRAVLATADGVHVVDLGNPLLPVIIGLVEPPVVGWTATGMAIRDHVVFIDWGNRIASYDITNAGSPPQLDVVLNLDSDFVVSDRWLVSWNGEPPFALLNVWDAADPANITLRGSITANISLATAQVCVSGDRVEVAHELGLEAYDIPMGSAPLEPLGFAWPVIEGWPLAVAGNTAWLQGTGRRYVIDLNGLTVPRVQARVNSYATASLQAMGDVLYFNPGDNLGVRIESLDDPRDPGVLTILDPTPDIRGIDVAGTLLAAADVDGLVLYDVTDPAAPVRLGHLDLDGAKERVVLVGDTAVVTAVRELNPDLVHVVDISDRDVPQLVATFEIDPDPDSLSGFRVWSLTRRGNRVHVMISVSGWTGTLSAITATIDLTAPQTPQLTYSEYNPKFWCYERDERFPGDALRPASDLPVNIGDFHVSFCVDTVSVYTFNGDPDAMELVTAWLAPGEVETIAAVGNKLLVLTEHRLDVLTLTDFDIIGVPDAVVTTSVRAVPNPFNPQTEITFEMGRAGAAEVTIYNVRGQPVRRLRADLPAGPASLTWRGTDQTGRALPSGTYLLRVITPGTVQGGSCALVR